MINQIVILCGGRGTRLGDLTETTPKPMLLFGGKPFLDHLIQKYSRYPIDEILLLAGFHGDQIHGRYENKIFNGVKIKVIIEKKPLGTLGAVLVSIDSLQPEFLLINGDSYVEFDFWKLKDWWDCSKKSYSSAMVIGLVKNSARYGQVKVSGNKILSLHEKGDDSSEGLINLGIYIIRKESLSTYMTDKKVSVSLERRYFPDIVETEKLTFYQVFNHSFIDFGIPKDLEKLQLKIESNPKHKAAFFDRDNTINFDKGYTHKTSDLILCLNIPEIIQNFNTREYKVFVVSNQSGVARGYYNEEDVLDFHRELKKCLADHGAFIDDFRFCPHHPIEGTGVYKKTCECRKPGIGMIFDLCKYWNLDLSESVFIGDSTSDQVCAERAGIAFLKATCLEQNSVFDSYLDRARETSAE